MQIKLDQQRQSHAIAPPLAVENSSENAQDAQYFSAALEQNTVRPAQTSSAGSNPLADYSEKLKSSNESIPKLLRDFVNEKNHLKAANAVDAMVGSKEILNIGVKVIKHCASFVEKTSNLQ